MGPKKDKDKEKENLKAKKAAEENLENGASMGKEETAVEQNGSRNETAEGEAIAMVMLPAEDVERLRAEVNVNLENWQRERADFLNFKKRIEREQQQATSRITGEIVKKYLPVLDDMERAIKALPEDAQDTSWATGIDLIYRKLQNIIEAEGVVKIPAETFDPTRHEAITHEPSPDHESGEIIEIVQQGYMLGDRVLRPALVRVAQ